jgi:ferredoxin
VKIVAQGKTIEYEHGANLRQVLLKNRVDLYNGSAKVINCRGIGSCGTCAVLVEGEVSATNWRDKTLKIASSPFSHAKPTLSLSNPSFR